MITQEADHPVHARARATTTPSDLSEAEVRAVTQVVNPLIANAFALYIKTKNYHWHVSGPHFRDYHLLFDEQAADVLATVDVLAERLRKLGSGTLRSLSQIAALQTIHDDNDSFVKPVTMLERLVADHRHLAKLQREAIAVCDKHRDTPTGNLLQEMLDQTEHRIWFLLEILRGG